jgi:hypothetical protein
LEFWLFLRRIIELVATKHPFYNIDTAATQEVWSTSVKLGEEFGIMLCLLQNRYNIKLKTPAVNPKVFSYDILAA